MHKMTIEKRFPCFPTSRVGPWEGGGEKENIIVHEFTSHTSNIKA